MISKQAIITADTLTVSIACLLTSKANPGSDVWLGDISLVELLIAVERDLEYSASLSSPTYSRVTSTHPPSSSFSSSSTAVSPSSISSVFHLQERALNVRVKTNE